MTYKPLDVQLMFTAVMNKARKEQKLTHRALAEKCGVPLSTVHGVLRGRPGDQTTGVSFRSICTIANGLGMSFLLIQDKGH
jgi:transcriptional regulator with XRE-family HTH domain